MSDKTSLPSLSDIRMASRRIGPFITRTPLLRSDALDEACGAHVLFKCEQLQPMGAFKLRGASNAVWSLDDEGARRGVATHSSGNHGAALACAAQVRGIPCTVVMPENAVEAKVNNVRRYGAEVVFCQPNQADREAVLSAIVADTGAHLIPPYDDERIIAGQGTCALEFLGQAPTLEVLITPVGGGGLISGCAIASKSLRPDMEVWGAEPAGSADAARSLKAGTLITDIEPDTICDGLRAIISPRTFRGLREHVEGLITVDDKDTIAAMRLIWRELKQVVEPSSAIALAALLNKRERFAGMTVGIVLTGGNVDLDQIPWLA